mgnify:CR=1 FL=1
MITNDNRLSIHSDQVEIDVTVNQQENYLNNRHIYFVIENHEDTDYSNILVRQTESNNCVLF